MRTTIGMVVAFMVLMTAMAAMAEEPAGLTENELAMLTNMLAFPVGDRPAGAEEEQPTVQQFALPWCSGVVYFQYDATEPVAWLVPATGGQREYTLAAVVAGTPINGVCRDGVCEFAVPHGMDAVYDSIITRWTDVVLLISGRRHGLDCDLRISAVQTLTEEDTGGIFYRPHFSDQTCIGRDCGKCILRPRNAATRVAVR